MDLVESLFGGLELRSLWMNKDGVDDHGRGDPFADLFKPQLPAKDPNGKPYAKYKGHQPGVGHLYDIVNGPNHGSTISEHSARTQGLELRANAPKAFKFDASNPAAVSWADAHAAELIDGISETTRDDIRDLVAESLEGEYDVADLASQISDLLGDDTRADLIARTESMNAANEGQLQLWDQAAEDGLINPNTAQKEWIVGDDEKLCPICQDMDGEQVGLDEDFNVDGEDIDAPPAHPNCRCTVALVP